ncbi:MAG TPA: CYTH domain-containing protein [Thermoanaerobaculia bacterium]
MGQEIERKFLVKGTAWKAQAAGTLYRQGYLSSVKERTVRVRIAGEKGSLTIKGVSKGVTRTEFEYGIPVDEAAAMLDGLCERPLIEKTRYVAESGGYTWEIDEFHGDNDGLIVAEVELQSPDEKPPLPEWVGEEVSSDPRYFNSNLVKKPFKIW